jgi:hypothetical protein
MLENGKLTKNGSNAIKGFAIIAMIAYHYWIRDYDFGTPFVDANTLYLIGRSLRYCVALFVFITGYGSYISLQNKKDTDLFRWAVRRIFSIWSGYIFFAILCIYLGTRLNWQEWDWHRIFEDFTAIHYSGDYRGYLNTWWYLPTAYILVLLAPFVKKAVDKYGAFILLLSFAFPLIFDKTYEWWEPCFLWLPILIEGMLAAKLSLRVSKSTLCNFIFGTFLLAVGTGICMICLELDGFALWIRFWLATPFLIYGIINICSCKPLKTILAFLGKYSFGMFLFHLLLYNAFFDELNILSQQYWLLPVLVVLLISLLVSIPITILSNSLFKKLRAAI